MNYKNKTILENVKKVLTYTFMYGWSRTLIKIKSQYHMKKEYDMLPTILDIPMNKNIGIIGCGNHAYSNTAYFIRQKKGNVIGAVLDIDINKAVSLSKEYDVPFYTNSTTEFMKQDNIDLVYIISNHATHTEYAIEAIQKGKDVLIEKPISVNLEQFTKLIKAIDKSTSNLYAGYNRPFSPAIKKIVSYVTDSPITLNCFILGHKLPSEHWYRKSNEGSRVVGNLGHWIDLSIHLLFAREKMISNFEITLLSANNKHKDDDFTVNIKTNNNDLIVLVFSTRSDPFEGVMENIYFQNENIIASIENFKKITTWNNTNKYIKKYIHKDVGHKKSVLQPFESKKRNWIEIEWSTLVMLKIEEMIQNDISRIFLDVETELKILRKSKKKEQI